jgi:isoleucyl-tRNA synthetase
VHPEMDYVRVKDKMNGSIYILAESRLVQIYPPKKKKKSKKKKSKKGADAKEEEKKDGDDLDYEILSRCKGKDLEGKKYVPLFPYFEDRAKSMNNFRVLTDTFVTDESGTGIVHMAPAFGEDDYRICAENKIISGSYKTLPCPVDGSGRFTEVVKDFVGLHVKDKKDAADEKICRWLKERKRLVKKNAYMHSYPFCWRSDTPLIYRAIPSWYVVCSHYSSVIEYSHSNIHTGTSE